jgi:DNA-binding transcriptional MocR family regulator
MMDSIQQLETQLSEISADASHQDLSIGRLTNQQIELSNARLFQLQAEFRYSGEEKIDTHNYVDGKPEGLYEARCLMGEIIGYPASEVFVAGNSSLELMRNYILHRCSERMRELQLAGMEPKLIIPVPGFYKHFQMCTTLGIEAVPVDISFENPDSDLVMGLIEADPGIMGMICVPRHSNPSGNNYHDACIRQLTCLAGEYNESVFHLLWDNVYAMHDHMPGLSPLLSLRDTAAKYGNSDYVATFGSTSKMTVPSSGIAAVGLSPAQHKKFCAYYNSFTVGPNRSLQLAHANFFKETPLQEHMSKLVGLMRPNFDVLLKTFDRWLSGISDVRWSKPVGGFFISMQLPYDCAKKTIEICNRVGVTLTPAGACYPNSIDPHDRHLRISPGFISAGEAQRVAETIALAIKLAIAQAPANNWR